jgi:serine/threonine-protein kinase HipA
MIGQGSIGMGSIAGPLPAVTPPQRSLNVFIDTTLIGVLSEAGNLWRFAYDPAWVQREDSFDICPSLPRSAIEHVDGASQRPVQWYFDNLLPEEKLREVVAKEAGLKDAQDAFALLTYLGAESAGSLTLLPPEQSPAQDNGLQELTDQQLSARIAQMPRDSLAKQAPKRMSVAGAQHKLLVVLLGDKTYEPVAATPSTAILKPDHPLKEIYPASTFNEWLTMRLAKAVGLNVPRVFLRYVPEPVYLIERFDRLVGKRKPGRAKKGQSPVAPPVQRLHVIDACQLLGLDRVFKHSAATLESLAEVANRCSGKLATRIALFRWLVFNMLVGNDDAHLKNLSFFVTPNSVELAPHYDLLATGAYHTRAVADAEGFWSRVPLSYALPGAIHFADVTREAVLAAAKALDLPSKTAERVLDECLARLQRGFAELKAEHAAIGRAIQEHAAGVSEGQALCHATEAWLLRIIDHIIIGEMVPKLSPAAHRATPLPVVDTAG